MRPKREIIYLVGFLLSMPIALTSYINSSLLETYFDQSHVGIIYIIAALLTILGMLGMSRILTRIGNRSMTLVCSLLFFVSLIVLALGQKGFVVIPAFILYFLSSNLLFASLDIFIEDFSKDAQIGAIRGIYLTTISFAWVVAQMISGSIISKSSLMGIYLLSALFTGLVYLIFILFLRDFKDPIYEKANVVKTIIFFRQHKNILKIYLINLLLKLFYSWMIIYTPIYLHQYIGFSWGEIGIIFSIMLLPFVILDFPLGKLSDRIGEKRMLVIGFLIMSLSTFLIPFFMTKTLYLWALILFLTRTGAATVESMSEDYFFKSVDESSVNILSFFRNTTPLSFLIGPIIAMPVLLFTPSFQYIFFVLSAMMLGGLLISFKLQDIK